MNRRTNTRPGGYEGNRHPVKVRYLMSKSETVKGDTNMKIKQLMNVMVLSDDQYVTVNDYRTHKRIDSVGGWVFEPDYDYHGNNYEEVERILNLTVGSAEFANDRLTIWTK